MSGQQREGDDRSVVRAERKVGVLIDQLGHASVIVCGRLFDPEVATIGAGISILRAASR